MTDDELRARLRATFQATAARTPIGADRVAEILSAPPARGNRPARPLVAAMSAAAAVVAVASVAAVVATRTPGGGPSVRTGTAASVVGTSTSTLPPASAVEGSPSGGSTCVPENYYVIASKQQLAGMTYLLPSAPTGYHTYGAWGTIARNGCYGSATWYVEYDKNAGDDKGYNIDLNVSRVAGRPAPDKAPETPPSAQPVTVNGHQGFYVDLNQHVGTLEWTADGLTFQLFGPAADGSRDSLMALAESLVAVAADDSRITPPPGCDVPAGDVCSGGSASAGTTTASATTASATPSSSSGAAASRAAG